jgi:hypothetical protein
MKCKTKIAYLNFIALMQPRTANKFVPVSMVAKLAVALVYYY